MTDEHKALVEALMEAAATSTKGWSACQWGDLLAATRAIRDLSAEVESLAAQLREQAILELAQMGQECDRHD